MNTNTPKSKSLIAEKAYAFALDIIANYKQQIALHHEYILSKQLLRAGTSIGANVNEAVSSESKRDFIHKFSIALKEARETSYWLSLAKDSGYMTVDDFNRLYQACAEIIRIVSSIILTTKARYLDNNVKE